MPSAQSQVPQFMNLHKEELDQQKRERMSFLSGFFFFPCVAEDLSLSVICHLTFLHIKRQGAIPKHKI